MKRNFVASLLALAFISTVPVFARPQLLSGAVSEEYVNELTSQIHWNTDLYQAEQQARREHKMVCWVHMLGKMDGAT